MTNQVIKIVRTAAQTAGGVATAAAAKIGLDIDSDVILAALIPSGTAAWIKLVDFAEENIHPAFGRLFVFLGNPTYETSDLDPDAL